MVQNTARNNSGALVPQRAGGQDGLGWWVEQYLQHAVTTSPASQRVQRRDLGRFLRYVQSRGGHRPAAGLDAPPGTGLSAAPPADPDPEGRRVWSDKTIQRILAHLKTFATWMHTHQPFPLGHPMAAINSDPRHRAGGGPGAHRRRTLAPARCGRSSPTIGGRSQDRKRYRTGSARAARATARIATAPSCIR